MGSSLETGKPKLSAVLIQPDMQGATSEYMIEHAIEKTSDYQVERRQIDVCKFRKQYN